MPIGAPKLRDDLITRQHETANGTSAVMKDPISGKFFRLGEAELFITQQLDGKTSIEEIRRMAESEFGAALPMDILLNFLNDLKKNGMLEAPDGKRRSTKNYDKRVRGNPLLYRIKLCDPWRLLKFLDERLRFLFTPYFVALSAAAIVLAVLVVAGTWSDFIQDVPRLYQTSTLPVVILTVFVVIVVHEFGHGMTCTHFGGEVHEMGFMLLLMQPAFYCNVSDAWLFPERSKRLWVGFAGPYFELFLWALAVFAWRATERDTWINFIALTIMATSGLKALLNFNPLIKLDGYYLLSDYLEIPNLRRRAFRYVGSLLERLFGIAPEEAEETLSLRERRIFAAYGVVALAGSFSILGYVLISAGGSLIAGRTPVAFLISLGLLTVKFRRRFRRMFAKPSHSSASFVDQELSTSAHAEEESPELPQPRDNSEVVNESSVSTAIIAPSKNTPQEAIEKAGSSAITAPAKSGVQLDTRRAGTIRAATPGSSARETKRAMRRLIWTGVGALGVASLFFFHSELRVGGALTILPVRNADLRTEIDGMIAEVLVTEGSVVHKGDLIAVMSTRENRSELDKTQALIREANAKLQLQQAGPTNDEIEVAKTAVVKAKDSFGYASAKLDSTKELFANALTARIELQSAEQFFATSKDDLVDAQERLKVLQNGTRPEQIAQTTAEISNLEAQRRFLKGQIDRAEIRSPVSGVVATPELELKEMAGQVVAKGALIAKVFQMSKLTVEIAVPESEIADVSVGEKVALKVRAYPNETFSGKVVAIATSALSDTPAAESGTIIPVAHTSPTASTPARTILVTTEIDNSSVLLKPGMTGHAKILCGQRRWFDIITRRFARTVKLEFWSWQ